MLPFEGWQRAMHNNGSPAGVDDMVLPPFVGAVLPGLGGDRENGEQEERKKESSHDKFPWLKYFGRTPSLTR